MSIKHELDLLMGRLTESINNNKNLSDDELVQLSVLKFGTILPNKIDKNIKTKLFSLGFIDNKNQVTKKGELFLKDKKIINRLKDISN